MSLIKTNLASTSTKVMSEGNLSERANYMKDQFGNQVKTGAKKGLAVAAVAGTTYAATKSSAVNNFTGKVLTKIANSKTFQKLAPKAKALLTKLNNLPGTTKAIALAGTALTAIAAYGISKEGAYNTGAIDQKYADKIELRKKLENN